MPPRVLTATFLAVSAAVADMVNDVVIFVELTTVTVPVVTPVPDTVTLVPMVVKPVPVSVTGMVVPRTPLFGLIGPSVGSGGLMTVNVKATDAFGGTPLLAVKVMWIRPARYPPPERH